MQFSRSEWRGVRSENRPVEYGIRDLCNFLTLLYVLSSPVPSVFAGGFFEIHHQMNPAESIWLGRRLDQFNPFFYEAPMLPDSPTIMGDIAANCNIPIATGESEPPKSDLLVNPLELVEGYLTVPDGPGLGIELNEYALSQPENPKVLNTPIGFDGSVQGR